VTVTADDLAKGAVCCGSPLSQRLTKAAGPYIAFHQQVWGGEGCRPHDAVAAASLVAPELFTFEPARLRVTVDGERQGRIDRVDGAPNAEICTGLGRRAVKRLILGGLFGWSWSVRSGLTGFGGHHAGELVRLAPLGRAFADEVAHELVQLGQAAIHLGHRHAVPDGVVVDRTRFTQALAGLVALGDVEGLEEGGRAIELLVLHRPVADHVLGQDPIVRCTDHRPSPFTLRF
jgi:hypothetical protein